MLQGDLIIFRLLLLKELSMSKIINSRYEIVKKIGSGGMAEVYLAKDLVLNRDVAVKVLRGDLSSDPVALLRFQREANAGSGLNHPNVVEIYDVGQDEDSQYIVMEYIKGVTAKELIHRRGSLEVPEAVDFMYQLALGLAKAHKQGIVHRDIKPQNILVKGDGTLKITDFGIAQSEDALQLTKTDSVIGSIHYLAPELVRGEGASVQSDIYALGIIFYEILTGEVPFSGDMPVEIAMKQLQEPIPSVQTFNPNIPNSVVNIINKATSKNVKNRYRSVENMIEDLTSALDANRVNELLWVPQHQTLEETKLISTISDVEEPEDGVGTKIKRNRKLIIGGIASLLLIMALIFALTLRGKKAFLMVDLSGMELEEAREALKEHNLYISNNIEYQFSDIFEKGQIISTLPEAGNPVEKGSQIRVFVSNGSYYDILDYKGLMINDVKSMLERETRLSVKVIPKVAKDIANGTILSQDGYAAGDKIDPNERGTIIFEVAADLELYLSDYKGMDVLKAKEALEGLGVVTELVPLPFSGAGEGLTFDVVLYTDPNSGVYYIQKPGSVVKIYYYDSEDKPLIDSETEIEEGETP